VPNTKTIASNAVIDFWAALVSARLEEGERLDTALVGVGTMIARFGQLRRCADKETVRMRA
jgi:hypothetical protein